MIDIQSIKHQQRLIIFIPTLEVLCLIPLYMKKKKKKKSIEFQLRGSKVCIAFLETEICQTKQLPMSYINTIFCSQSSHSDRSPYLQIKLGDWFFPRSAVYALR